ncbi:MAG: HAMP domain-containing sensor histidine kinase [Parvularculaceae bacterium]
MTKKTSPFQSSFRQSLSFKLLVLTILFVLFAEFVVLVPSIANQRLDWFTERLEAAYLVAVALDSPGGEMIQPERAEQLFATANILGVTLDRDGARMPIMAPQLTKDQARIMRFVDLNVDMPQQHAADAWATIFSKGDGSIRVVGTPRHANGAQIDIIVSQAALRKDLLVFSRNVLLLSLVISTLTAALLYGALTYLIVRPLRKLTSNMMAFESNPDDASVMFLPSERHDEIGVAERGLASLEQRIHTMLGERRRLAALGAGISKISHDLRNILASAQLMSDRLSKSDDPRVAKLTPRLIAALDRAISLSRDTLSYARMDPSSMRFETIKLRGLVEEALEDSASMTVEIVNEVDGEFELAADSTQLYRAIFNLIKNAVEAFSSDDRGEEHKKARVIVRAERRSAGAVIEIEDNGPGIPDAVRDKIFEPFKGSMKPGGSGLGVAIAAEIARAHGGSLEIARSDKTGTLFKIFLPNERAAIQ